MNTCVNPQERKVYLVGAGIASLASAVYFIQEGHISPKNICIFEQQNVLGGSLDGAGNSEDGYISHGARMFDKEAYACTYDLFSRVPSLNDPNLTVLDDFNKFNKDTKFNRSNVRLIGENAERIDVLSFQLSRGDQLMLSNMMIQPECKFEKARICDCFSEEFFHTNFWYMWCTTFAFQPWHSAIEFRRYLHRFVHEFPHVTDLAGVRHSRYNQYDSITLPIVTWLKNEGVVFKPNCKVTNFQFEIIDGKKSVKLIEYKEEDKECNIDVTPIDLVLATVGSMTAAFSVGDNDTKTEIYGKDKDGSWDLWENLSKIDDNFGHPQVFDERIKESLWESITMTFKTPLFFDLMRDFCGGTGTEVTFKDSNWFLSIVLPKQPYFIDQPDDVQVAWGYALHPDKEGNFVHKKMCDCTGKEIMEEICGLLKFNEHKDEIIKSTICKGCVMPFITSQFLTRSKGDRPEVVPKTSHNLAFIGQFCEIKDDTVFTVDYSVRSAQIAVYTLLGLNYKEVTPIYLGEYDTRVLLGALATMIK
ncbi:oleate hydratase [Clostridium tarantellae]|uniref:Oleate hydratase n=1 Tax=Clostridium tarantellae TaxID=39493 RepID=A0A6I1MPL3_9CLOT|nr:oleate hydratase [Clostridium tarantellae]MPQ44743.1 oleate hydratase [Clostridium tarantellae]